MVHNTFIKFNVCENRWNFLVHFANKFRWHGNISRLKVNLVTSIFHANCVTSIIGANKHDHENGFMFTLHGSQMHSVNSDKLSTVGRNEILCQPQDGGEMLGWATSLTRIQRTLTHTLPPTTKVSFHVSRLRGIKANPIFVSIKNRCGRNPFDTMDSWTFILFLWLKLLFILQHTNCMNVHMRSPTSQKHVNCWKCPNRLTKLGVGSFEIKAHFTHNRNHRWFTSWAPFCDNKERHGPFIKPNHTSSYFIDHDTRCSWGWWWWLQQAQAQAP